jgi:YidC/Oxa1 family membrane protein insertase
MSRLTLLLILVPSLALGADGWNTRYAEPDSGRELFHLETSGRQGTLSSYKLLVEQYAQKQRVAVPGEPEDHVNPGPMEMVTTWDPEFYPFQTRLLDVAEVAEVYRRAADGSEVRVAWGDLAGAVMEWAQVETGKDFVRYVWPDPRAYRSNLYLEKRLGIAGPYQLALQVKVHALGSQDLRHRLVVETYGYQNPLESTGGMFSPPPDLFGAVCSAAGEVARGGVADLAQEAKEQPGNVDFAGIESRYFMSALVPLTPGQSRCVLRAQPFGLLDVVVESLSTGVATVGKTRCFPDWYAFAPAEQRCSAVAAGVADKALLPNPTTYDFLLYIGPKDIGVLTGLGHNLEGSLDFWVVGFLAKPMLYLLRIFHGFIPHWGVAILLLTLVVKLLTWYWSQKSYVQMREMQKLKPELDKLKAKFKDDRTRLNTETMALYKRYKINPLGGCLPMLIQMPIWIALYRTIYSSVELYQAPLFGWITDLSAPDRYFILPALLGVSMFAQQWMTPSSGMDEAQAKIMKWVMPIMFTAFMLFLPSGLNLYIFVNTALSVGQQVWVNKRSAKP